MKKIILLSFILFFVTLFSNAQLIEKNQKIVGGSLSFQTGTAEDTSTNSLKKQTNNFSILLSPSYGKAIKTNLVFGYSIAVGFNSSRSKDQLQLEKNKGYQTGASVFIEKFHALGKNFFISSKLSLGANYSSSDYKRFYQGTYQYKIKTTGYGAALNFSPGLEYLFNKKLLVEFGLNNFISLGYHQDKTENKGPFIQTTNSKHEQFSLSSQINYSQMLSNFMFGFRYILR